MKKLPKGYELLQDPLLNKEGGFSEQERDELGLLGLLPFQSLSSKKELERAYLNFSAQEGELGKALFLHGLRSRNEHLFYRLLLAHLEEMVPLVYTPTVGAISKNYSLLYTEQRGLYLSYPHKDRLFELICNFPYTDIDVAVMTDGERVLGLGDLGVGGMAISTGKLALYTLFGGIAPQKTLPILLDVGTNNEILLQDPLYLGWRHPRIIGKDYDHFVEQVVSALKHRFPKILLQWEDFSKGNALSLLNRYRQKLCSFNDDIQGTAAVTLAAIYSALNALKVPLKEQKIAVFGAGSAGLGICNQVLAAMLEEGGSTKEEALERFYLVDRVGLIHDKIEGGCERLDPGQKLFAQKSAALAHWKVANKNAITLQEVVENAHPTILIGVSTQRGAFTKEIVSAMHKAVARPMIFPLSNPTSCAEADPKDLIEWTQGKALIATGTPFPPVTFQNKRYEIAQCNNVYIFPGVGLGLIATKAKKASDQVFITAAKTLSAHSPILKDPLAPLFPRLSDLRRVTREIAIEVAKVVIEENEQTVSISSSVEELVDKIIWSPRES